MAIDVRYNILNLNAFSVKAIGLIAVVVLNIAVDNIEVLFYNSPDYVMCASQIDRILQDKSLAMSLSVAARGRRLVENNPATVVNTQLEIYRSLINANS